MLKDIVGHAGSIQALISTVGQGDYTAAAASFLGQYGAELGIDAATGGRILTVASSLETAGDVRGMLRADDHAEALQTMADALGLPLDDATIDMLGGAAELRDAMRDGNLGSASRSAANLAQQAGHPALAARLEQLNHWLDSMTTAPGDARTPPYVPDLTAQGA